MFSLLFGNLEISVFFWFGVTLHEEKKQYFLHFRSQFLKLKN